MEYYVSDSILAPLAIVWDSVFSTICNDKLADPHRSAVKESVLIEIDRWIDRLSLTAIVVHVGAKVTVHPVARR